MWPPGSWRIIFTLSHWPRAICSRVCRPFLARFGSGLGLGLRLGLGLGVGLGGGLGLRPYLYPTRECFLRANVNSPLPQRSWRLLGELKSSYVAHLIYIVHLCVIGQRENTSLWTWPDQQISPGCITRQHRQTSSRLTCRENQF